MTERGTDPGTPLRYSGGPAATSALDAYQKATGIALHTDSLKTSLAGVHSHGVHGMYSNQQALRELLAGTGLSVSFDDATNATVAIRSSESVDVAAGAGEGRDDQVHAAAAGHAADGGWRFRSSCCTTSRTDTLRDAVRNVPGISMAAGESGAQGDNLTIRGFTARNDIFLDGIRDFGSYYRDSFNYRAGGGAGRAGGRAVRPRVDRRRDQPGEQGCRRRTSLSNVETQFGTDLTRRVTADINEPLPDVAEGAAFRLNLHGALRAAWRGGRIAENRRFGVAPSMSLALNSPTRRR